ncbi:hypothetical protein MSHOH_2766 [Methanosarcina horonobensis HB-1 = JCM 15518]|uniref:Tetratricopeptide repeat protein n=2 Tax=Methanosarcina horonobensis TaxID=418008 RepID=A0A0E3SBN1_9EURY|nr:tetratricopeptide repeat protein [Methanosarcina horonobensis]AKB79249.1 hypothetical protein MSHOH_2766 [Methanosarcina horonobensis HB-1 = JCM 15518]
MIKKSIPNFLILLLVLASLGCISNDSDDDGYPDNIDAFPKDYNYHLDSDGDRCADEIDAFPNDVRYKVESDRLNSTNNPEELCQYGNELLEAKNYEQSIEYFDKSLSIKYNEKVLNRKSLALFHLHNYEETIECADEVLKNNENNTFALCMKAGSFSRLGDIDQANKYADMAIESDPSNLMLLELKDIIASENSVSENDFQDENDLTSKIKLDLNKMGYPNAQVKLFDQIKWIEIDIGKFESTTVASPSLEPQFEYIAERIGSSTYVYESGYDKVCVKWKVYWNIEGDGTIGTSAHGSNTGSVYYHVREAKITYY